MGAVYGILIHPPLLLAEKRGDRCLDSGSTSNRDPPFMEPRLHDPKDCTQHQPLEISKFVCIVPEKWKLL